MRINVKKNQANTKQKGLTHMQRSIGKNNLMLLYQVNKIHPDNPLKNLKWSLKEVLLSNFQRKVQ